MRKSILKMFKKNSEKWVILQYGRRLIKPHCLKKKKTNVVLYSIDKPGDRIKNTQL